MEIYEGCQRELKAQEQELLMTEEGKFDSDSGFEDMSDEEEISSDSDQEMM